MCIPMTNILTPNNTIDAHDLACHPDIGDVRVIAYSDPKAVSETNQTMYPDEVPVTLACIQWPADGENPYSCTHWVPKHELSQIRLSV